MHRGRLFCFLFTICAAMLVPVAVAQTTASGEIQLGQQALSQGKYDEAIQHFEAASDMVPANVIVQLKLADVYAQQYVPGVDNPDNVRMAEQAISHYQRVIDGDMSRTSSLSAAKGIALLKAQMNDFDGSKDYYGRAERLDPRDPEPYYFIALIDWTLSSQVRKQARTKLGLKAEDSLAVKDPKACVEVRDKNSSNLDEAIDNLNKALELRPTYADAMNYMSLSYVERADIHCDDPAARKADLKSADEWAQKLAALKKLQATHPQKQKADDDDE
ncbi:MAG: tetratricopeptide repeat protein [Terriglobales bacterium]